MGNIPKVIHYCWFGGNPLPEEYVKYIESWKKYLPDYEIKRWDESNFDFSTCDYAREAYEAKKWAFVSDYVRLKVVYDNGGLYFDTDVEVIKPIDDIVEKGAFMGLEMQKMKKGAKDDIHVEVATGLGFGAPAGMEIYKDFLEKYESMHFLNADGSYNQITTVKHITEVFKKYGFDGTDTLQTVGGITLYPSEYFDPIDCATGEERYTENTVTVHHYSASWMDGKDLLKMKIKKLLGHRVTGVIISLKRLLKKSEE